MDQNESVLSRINKIKNLYERKSVVRNEVEDYKRRNDTVTGNTVNKLTQVFQSVAEESKIMFNILN